ncbi:transcriptional regulator with XRE-family HTH domain [Saccharothrix tamanrassetensis]|uniref:Transcriptional regulator with XRE-family HTH domain n=1 Tax=Saccharothrix tamanrassetensis TaxID=1051531 RepID=A0A841CLD2_9PSEU|nr:helix-turn-helix transcriptional regulator [Saccharothrix tamanrassetensis]MBB5957900.1 transcriptional regulator with XRE-family HTH domain [Saccharothrix tamanrassetensis]
MIRSTAKAMALGTKLRAVREAAGVGQRELARLTGIHAATMNRYESGERPPSEEATILILDTLGVVGPECDEILELVRDDPAKGSAWLAVGLPEQRVQLDALLQIEQLATEIIDVSPLVVPGLLQSSGYTRAIMRGGAVPESEIETRVAIRMGRRDVLTRSRPVRYTALMGNHVMRQQFGGPAARVEQLDHLRKMAELPNVELRIFPIDAGWHAALHGPFSLITIGGSETIVHLENHASGLFIQEKDMVAVFQEVVERVTEISVDPEFSA